MEQRAEETQIERPEVEGGVRTRGFSLQQFLHRGKRSTEAQPPVPRDDVEVVAERTAQMTPRLRNALDRELCPEEQVDWIIPPQAGRQLPLRIAVTCAFGVFASLVAGMPLAAVLGCYSFLACLLTAIALVDRTYQSAYVLTSQRCFQLAAWGWGVQVKDITEMPRGLRLEVADRTRLRNGLWELEKKRGSGEISAAVEAARISGGLPARLRQKVEAALMPGETLRWAERPSPRRYFANAPLDAPTTLGFLAGFILAVVGALPPTHTSWVGIGAGLLTAALASLWRQVSGTVYAVTDRRGLIVSPGGRIRSYAPRDLMRFQRTQDQTGRGTLAPPGSSGEGFFGVRNAKLVDDLIKQRAPRDASTELAPAEALPGRGDELGPA